MSLVALNGSYTLHEETRNKVINTLNAISGQGQILNAQKVADIVRELAQQLDCTPYEIVDNLVGMVISEEDETEIKEKISGR